MRWCWILVLAVMTAGVRGQATEGGDEGAAALKAYGGAMKAFMGEDVATLKKYVHAPGAEGAMAVALEEQLAMHAAGKEGEGGDLRGREEFSLVVSGDEW